MDFKEAIQGFFTSYLLEQRGVSPHTLKSYRDTIRLFLEFIQKRRGPSKPLTFSDLDSRVILDFLKSLEDKENGRGNAVTTRNHRLTAIHSLVRYLAWHYPAVEREANRIRAIPFKPAPIIKMDFLTHQELKAVFAQIDSNRSDGFRDLALLTFLYNTGARAQEAADVRISWFDFTNQTVSITGKGRKQRIVPLWDTTVKTLQIYIKEHRRIPKLANSDILFINQRRLPFSRFGIWYLVHSYTQKAQNKCDSLKTKKLSTHSFRHTTAMHLLEAGVEPNVIKSWLGHSSVDSTSRYLDADLTHKKRALDKFAPPIYVESPLEEKSSNSINNILDWLTDL